jgi:hypothetical protein
MSFNSFCDYNNKRQASNEPRLDPSGLPTAIIQQDRNSKQRLRMRLIRLNKHENKRTALS